MTDENKDLEELKDSDNQNGDQDDTEGSKIDKSDKDSYIAELEKKLATTTHQKRKLQEKLNTGGLKPDKNPETDEKDLISFMVRNKDLEVEDAEFALKTAKVLGVDKDKVRDTDIFKAHLKAKKEIELKEKSQLGTSRGSAFSDDVPSPTSEPDKFKAFAEAETAKILNQNN